MRLLYTTGIYIYFVLAKIAALFNAKAKLWTKGQKHILQTIASQINPKDEIVWFHSASLGEFEQGRPIIEAFKTQNPQYKILLTFFSPSGYEIRKNYQGADYIFYLPIDTMCNARKFVEMVNLKKAFFIKYEFWFNYLKYLRKAQIPTYFVSAIFREDQYFFKPWGKWFRKHFDSVSRFFVQNEKSAILLQKHGINQVTVSGDTRFDRVFSVAQQPQQFPLIEQFKGENKILLTGSSWEAEEDIISRLSAEQRGGVKFILAPHEIGANHLEKIQQKFSHIPTLLFSQATDKNVQDAQVLIIDSIGKLSHLYQYSDIAFIGGGFGKGLHNILEAAAFGKPIIFGAPNYQKFQEAHDLLEIQGAFAVKEYQEFVGIFSKLFSEQNFYLRTSQICQNYIAEKKGATEKILQMVKT